MKADPSIHSRADLAVINANIITVDPKMPRAEAMAVRGDTFAFVGESGAAKAFIGKDTEVLDLKGKTVVPGFIDAHTHVLSSGVLHVTAVDCGLGSVSEIKAALRERASITPKGEWMQGFKYDDTKTVEGRKIDRNDLDEVSTDHPIFLMHRGLHTFFLNSRAMELAGIREGSVPPVGGRYDTDPATGGLNGVIHERAADRVRNLLPQVDSAKRMQGLKFISRMFNSSGLTSVHDAMVGSEALKTYQDCLEKGELDLRVYALMGYNCLESLVRSPIGYPRSRRSEMLRIGGIKLVADGAIAGRTAYLSQPYEGSADDRGILAMEPEEIEEKVSAVHQAGFQACVHANGDSAIEIVLSAYEKALKSLPRENCRHRIEHCTVITPSILERLRRLGCIVTPFCTYVYYNGDKMRFYGEKRAAMMFAHRSFLDMGIISTGATDYSPGPYQPLLGIQSMVTRTDMNGNVWGANQRVSVEEAIRIYTLHGAYASFEEDIKGSITEGKLADFVVLGADPTEVDPGEIKDIPVERTVVGGKTVFEF